MIPPLALGRGWREEVIGDCLLILADCMDVLPTLGKVDAVVTDPPYGIGQAKGFGTGGFGITGRRRKHDNPRQYKDTGWDSNRPDNKVFEAILDTSEAHIIWGGNYFSDLLPMSQKWLWWDKLQTMPSYSDGELAWTSLPGASTKKFTYAGAGMMAREKGRVHPTQKPIELMSWCLNFLPDAETILDPFMGSGTTGVACVKMGRKFIGIEREPEYFEIACKRIREAYAQPDMLIEVQKQMTQEPLL